MTYFKLLLILIGVIAISLLITILTAREPKVINVSRCGADSCHNLLQVTFREHDSTKVMLCDSSAYQTLINE